MTLFRRPSKLRNRCDRCNEFRPLVWRSCAGKFYCEGCGGEWRLRGVKVVGLEKI